MAQRRALFKAVFQAFSALKLRARAGLPGARNACMPCAVIQVGSWRGAPRACSWAQKAASAGRPGGTRRFCAAEILLSWVGLRAQAEDARPLPPALAAMHAELAQDFAPVIEDRALEGELRLCLARIRSRHWGLYA